MSAPRIGAMALLASLALLAPAAAQTTTTPGDASTGQTAQDLALPGTVTEKTPPKATSDEKAGSDKAGTGDGTGSAGGGTGSAGGGTGSAGGGTGSAGGGTGSAGGGTGSAGGGTGSAGGGTGSAGGGTGTAGDGANAGGTGDSSTAAAPAPPLDRPAKSQTGGVAGSQPESQRRSEYKRSCKGKDKTLWPVSRLAAIAGSQVTDRQDRWPWYVLALAGLIVFVTSAVWGWRYLRARHNKETAPPVGLLSGAGALVGLLLALPGIVGLVLPGVGTQHHPPAQATMAVREVQARITRGDFIGQAVAPSKRPTLKNDFDAQEVGHVVWLELDLSGFRGDDLTLTWASYSRPGGYSLIPKTDDAIPVKVGAHSDAETRFLPIWVGLPKYEFQVRFRLIDDRRELRQVARTGDMRGSLLRYNCA